MKARTVVVRGGSPHGRPLNPTMSAASAWRKVFQQLTDQMTSSVPGVLSGTEPEDLHAFRVAVRKIRTLLQDGVHLVDPKSRERFRHAYRWLGDITTPTRDADVHLIEFPKLVAALPSLRREELAAFIDLLVRHRTACHASMTVKLSSIRRAEFGAAWLRFLADDDTWTSCGELAKEPIIRILFRRVEKARRHLVKNGRKISKKSPPTALHELRKEGKRLRYLLECFTPLFDEKPLDEVLRPLRKLQDVLGEFQDTEVQANALRELAAELASGKNRSALMAIRGAIEQLEGRGSDARAAFAKTFRRFDDRKVKHAFAQLEIPTASRKKLPPKKKP